MTWLDRLIRDWRIAQAEPYVRDGERVLDIGCLDQTLLRRVAGRVRQAVGVDPLAEPEEKGNIRILKGVVPGSVVLPAGSFDCITMLAVLEHIPDTEGVARECARLLAPGGRVVITVPVAQVDHVLSGLRFLRLIDGMSLEEHHGFDVKRTGPVFEGQGLRLSVSKWFEFGLNRLFVFEKPEVEGGSDGAENGDGGAVEPGRSGAAAGALTGAAG